MQIVRLQNEKSISDLVSRLYGLNPSDPRSSEAAKELLTANPHLAGDVSKLPSGTPVIVPAIAGLNPSSSGTVDPKRAALMDRLDKLVEGVGTALAAPPPAGVKAPTKATAKDSARNKQLKAALAALKVNVETFKKLHS